MSARDDMLAAEFALGALARDAHTRAARRTERDPEFRERVERWQGLLAGLEPAGAEATPSASVWTRIEAAVDDLEGAPGTRTVRREQGAWEQLGPGIEKKLLNVDPESGAQSYLMRLAPGARLPPHDHETAEECLVVEGELCIGDRCIGPGEYHLAPAGVHHAVVASKVGAVFFIRGAL